VEQAAPTAWVPRSKPIHFTELGCAAIDKGPNQPNVFADPKSAENALPYFSTGGRSDLAQYRFLLAHYLHWQEGGPAANPVSPLYGGPMVDVDEISVWAWDSRPFPAFPLEAEVWGDGGNWSRGHWLNGRLSSVSVDALIAAILADHGLPRADTQRADGMVTGYAVDNPTTARAAIEPVATLFGIAARDGEEGLVFATEGAEAGKALHIGELVIPGEREALERVREPDHALPAFAQLDFTDAMNSHQSATAMADYVGARGSGTTFVSFPGALAAGEAGSLVRNLLRRSWDGRERVTFAVPMAEQQLEPGSVLRLPGESDGPDYLVTEIEDGLTRLVRARRIVRVAAPPAQEVETPRGGDGIVAIPSVPHALFLDLPLRSAQDAPQDQLRIAARSAPWLTQAVLASPEDTGFGLRTTILRRAIIGVLEEALPPGSIHGRLDRGTRVTVRLFDGELESVSRIQMLNGANAAAIRSAAGIWEILQFEEAEEIAASIWRLSGILRGQLGTNDAMAAGTETGAPFVLLDEAAAPAGLTADEIGLDLNWRVGPVGYDISEENFLATSTAGGTRALMPLSPVHLKARMENDDLHLSWIRRGRHDADSWIGEDIPLGEEQEFYRVDIAPAGGAVLRSVTTAIPRWIYTRADQATDFPERPSVVEVLVRQLSAAVGEGIPLRRRIELA
jgi:hypothetical protein